MATTGAAWPAVRAPLRDGWDATEDDGVRRTAMDAGPTKKRVDSTAEPNTETFAFKWTTAHADLVKAHYAANKALRFSFPHPLWGTVEACYAGAIRWREQGIWRIATVQLEIYE